ncbi:hypothetical protein [Pseudobacteriovorax antillogorgiicola]|uniref:Peptidase family M48 n=1 Tax=Pseudobacteriovorax antillogorgiicola TaxID=1513793 RepID=A0A1Y6BV30_9BACT|nr:hypothetical protein [Pseudobacteriovorax antillogorgiicola]TCS52321.1 hypothetical protein EDD56_10965 [Pseudobacteriovorax antillogorgiicola]SMF30079.1 hypothetical protein SAMN06296036_109148 [Pseudobacteriovorax antillogorgiicola]
MLTHYLGAMAALFLIAGSAHATILPPNTLHLEDTVLQSNVTEEQFNEAIDKAEAYYKPLIQDAFGASLRINRRWSDSTVNASASQFFGSWNVNMYGGLARRPEVTIDGFALVLCHELGHHLGGYPYSSSWAANEGQSDYFSTISCARELWRDEVDINASFRASVDPLPKALCDKVWVLEVDQDLCYRSMMGGKALADLLSALRNQTVSFETPSKSKVSRTDNSHPAGQCRLDTYMAGALCDAEWDPFTIPGKSLGSRRNGADGERDSLAHTCSRTSGTEVGVRPACWFKTLL